MSPGAGSLPRGLQRAVADCGAPDYPARRLRLNAPYSRFEMQSQYLWDFVRLGIGPSLRALLQRVRSPLPCSRIEGRSKSRRRPRGRAWEWSPSEAPVAYHLSLGKELP